LKPGLKWADGVALTTKDVAFSLEAGKRPDLGFNNPDLYAAIDKVEVIDAANFVIHFNKVRYDFDHLVDFAISAQSRSGYPGPTHSGVDFLARGSRRNPDDDPAQCGIWLRTTVPR
jgi:ABC-type transport system substrate-binding protein